MANTPRSVSIRYLGGPTAVLRVGGLRFLTDPTFDPPGSYPIGNRALVKTLPPAASPEEVGTVDAVLLSHDQHPDNLDGLGRAYVDHAALVLSTPAAAERLAGPVRALAPWDSVDLEPADGSPVTVTAVPARHGPAGAEALAGAVTGFVLSGTEVPTIYVSGDNASLEIVEQIATRFETIDVALLFAGAARTALLDGAHLTLTSEQAAEAARLLGARQVLPLHFEGWEHFSQGRESLVNAFAGAGLTDRLHLLEPGEQVDLR